MTTKVLQDIISRCHQRHESPLTQKKTRSVPPLYKGYPYHFKVFCADKYPVMLQDLEAAGISFMPIGQAPGTDCPPRNFGGERFLQRQEAADWDSIRWLKSWGIQVYTGIPSAYDGAPWHDITFKYEILCAAPDAVLACIQALIDTVANPLLTMTKSGGLRFSCRIPEYLHPSTKPERLSVHKTGTMTAEDLQHHDAYIEIWGEKGYNCWDARYEVLFGSLLDPPIISKEVFFAPINALLAALPEPVLQSLEYKQDIPEVPYFLESGKLELAKEAFLKRGFSYHREENRIHYWVQQDTEIGTREVSMWEDEGGVWVRASTVDLGLPMKATLITDVWNDTGILPPNPETVVPIDDKVISIREGNLSPLAIKRPRPILHKTDPAEKTHETPEEINVQTQQAFDRNVRILGLIPETTSEKRREIESLLQEGEVIRLNMADAEFAAEAEHFFQNLNVESVSRWRDRMYLWDQVKDIPVDVRMEDPFQHGNVCEDADRCETIEKKGGDPSDIICPQCPVYTACQERGYLSQYATLQTINAQIIEDSRLFLDPQYAKTGEQLLKTQNGAPSLCVVHLRRENQLFLKCELSIDILEEWMDNWQDDALGNFAIVLLNAVKIRDKSHAESISRLRTAVRIFEWLEEEIIQQMCHVNVQGRVVAREIIDAESGEELARWTIEFEGGIFAHIPVDAEAVEKLVAQDLPIFQLNTFVPNEDMKILMSIADAVRLGIFDVETIENIQTFPTVCQDPDWTFWHQLKRFFDYYKRDADAPMRWEDEILRFRVPPVLHPNVRRLLLAAPILNDEHLSRAFLDEKTEIIRPKQMEWMPGNCVFQVRTGIYPRKTVLDLSNTWDSLGVSETGQDIFLRIQAEIERDTDIKHGIITHIHAIEQLKDIAKRENVSFLTGYRMVEGLENAFQEAQVIWIVGLPEIGPRSLLERTQILFGNDKKPLSYEMEPKFYRYKDERVQSVYEKEVLGIFTEIIELAQLNSMANKKIMLVTSLQIPEITDRPETLLFDLGDLDAAGGLDKLSDMIATRQGFEKERDQMTVETSRIEVERILGCSSRQANRMLQRMRGGRRARVTFREQIIVLLADGEKKTPDIIEVIEGHPKAINNELTRLVNKGDIVKVKRGVYTLPKA